MSHLVTDRSLEHAREDVIQALGVHFASDDISVEELDRRLTLAFRASTHDELRDLLADLPMLPEFARGSVTVSRTVAVTSGDVPARGFLGALLGAATRKGVWHVPQHLKVFAVMGGVQLDLSSACLGPGVTEIDLFVLMGGVDIIVPHGVRVEALGFAMMGGIEASAGDTESNDPNQPVIRLSGVAVMGGVDARHKRPSTGKLKKFEKRLTEVRGRIRGQ